MEASKLMFSLITLVATSITRICSQNTNTIIRRHYYTSIVFSINTICLYLSLLGFLITNCWEVIDSCIYYLNKAKSNDDKK